MYFMRGYLEAFNKTRGALRLLALIIHNILRNRINCSIISTDSVDLTNPDIKDELTSRIDRGDFKVIVESDCIKKAKSLDANKNVKLAEPIARTIYL